MFCCPCPAGGNCTRGALPVALEGWIGLNSSFFLQCSPDEACKNDQCVSPPYGNRQGACNKCVEGYYRKDRLCVECPRTAALVLAIGVIFFFVALLVILKFSKTSEVNSFAFQISLGFIQLISIYATLPFNWPAATTTMFDVLSFTNFNIDLFSPECAISSSYWSKWVLKMMFPVIAVGGFGLLYQAVRRFEPLRKLYIRWLLLSPLENLLQRRTVMLTNSSIQLGKKRAKVEQKERAKRERESARERERERERERGELTSNQIFRNARKSGGDGDRTFSTFAHYHTQYHPHPRTTSRRVAGAQAYLWEEENLSARFVSSMVVSVCEKLDIIYGDIYLWR